MCSSLCLLVRFYILVVVGIKSLFCFMPHETLTYFFMRNATVLFHTFFFCMFSTSFRYLHAIKNSYYSLMRYLSLKWFRFTAKTYSNIQHSNICLGNHWAEGKAIFFHIVRFCIYILFVKMTNIYTIKQIFRFVAYM